MESEEDVMMADLALLFFRLVALEKPAALMTREDELITEEVLLRRGNCGNL